MNKVTNGTQTLVLFIQNNTVVVDVGRACSIAGTAEILASISGVLNISSIIQFFWTMQVKLYFKINQRKTERSLNITQIFFMEQEFLCLMCYYVLFSIIFVLYSESLLASRLFFHCLPNHYYHYFYSHHHSLSLFNNSTNFLVPWNNCHCTLVD